MSAKLRRTVASFLAAALLCGPAAAQARDFPYLFADPLRTMPAVVEKGVILPGDAAPFSGALKQDMSRPLALSEAVDRFCAGQSEPLDPALVVDEQVNADCIRCVIPVRVIDHESPHPFSAEVRFLLHPATRLSERVAAVDECARGGS